MNTERNLLPTAKPLLGLLLALAILLMSSPSATATTVTATDDVERSPLCQHLDAGYSDAYGTVAATFTIGFWGTTGYVYAGETITFTPGTVPNPDEAILSLSVRTSGEEFDPVAISDAGAASVSWTVPTTTALSGLRSNVSTGNFQGMTWTCTAAPDEPPTSVDDLRHVLTDLDLHVGMAHALDAKLALASDRASTGDAAGACAALDDFLHLVATQEGKQLRWTDVILLRSVTSHVQEALGC